MYAKYVSNYLKYINNNFDVYRHSTHLCRKGITFRNTLIIHLKTSTTASKQQKNFQNKIPNLLTD